MVYAKLVKLIEDNAEELPQRLVKDLLSRDETREDRMLSEDLVRERVRDMYSKLGSWLETEKHISGEIRKVYTELGKKRFREGIPLNEVILAFMLIHCMHNASDTAVSGVPLDAPPQCGDRCL